MKYSVTIIGCGSIGALKPNEFDSPATDNILTHAHACHKHPRIELNGFYDPNMNKFLEAYYKWLAPFPEYQGAVFKPFESDIYIVAADTSIHKTALLKILEYNPRLVVCEKPCGSNLTECQEIVKAYKSAKIPLVVNITRRFAPGYHKQRTLINEAYSAILHYNRGLVRDGCHGIDLFRWFFGEITSCRKLSDFEIHDLGEHDPTVGVLFEAERCPHCLMLPLDARNYASFEFDIWHKHGRTRFIGHGETVEITKLHREEIYGGYSSLSINPTYEKTELAMALPMLYDEITSYLDAPSYGTLSCTGDDALKVWEILEKLI
jgi:predicted dehydrogenase